MLLITHGMMMEHGHFGFFCLMPCILLLVFANWVLEGVKVALTCVSKEKFYVCNLCLFPSTASRTTLLLLLNNPNGFRNPKPFQQQYSGFLCALRNAASCSFSEAEAIHRKALISSTSQNPSGQYEKMSYSNESCERVCAEPVSPGFVTRGWKQESHVFKKPDSNSWSFLIINPSFLCHL